MNAIAAAVIGGTSLFGGRGRTWSALLGVLVISPIQYGLALQGIATPIQYMITGGVLLADGRHRLGHPQDPEDRGPRLSPGSPGCARRRSPCPGTASVVRCRARVPYGVDRRVHRRSLTYDQARAARRNIRLDATGNSSTSSTARRHGWRC